MKFLCLLVGLVLPLHSWAQQITDGGDSPSGKIHIEYRTSVDDKGNQAEEIWLSPSDAKDKAVMLCYGDRASVHISPDDFWIMVENGGGSLGIDLTLYQRVTGVTYKEMKDAAIGDKAEKLALEQNGLPLDAAPDHRYVRVVDWSPDSKYVLIGLSGHIGVWKNYHIGIERWDALYDLGTGKFTFDLGKFNAGAVTKTPRVPPQ